MYTLEFDKSWTRDGWLFSIQWLLPYLVRLSYREWPESLVPSREVPKLCPRPV